MYFVAKAKSDRWLVFESQDKKYAVHFAGWDKERPRFIVQALVDLYGPTEAKEIYDKFMQWLLHIEEMQKNTFNSPAASLVLYERKAPQ